MKFKGKVSTEKIDKETEKAFVELELVFDKLRKLLKKRGIGQNLTSQQVELRDKLQKYFEHRRKTCKTN